MNGSGDIGIKHISEDKFTAKPLDMKLWILYSATQSLAATCHAREECCNVKFEKKFMPRFSKKALVGMALIFLAALYGPDIFKEDSPLWKFIMAII